MCISLRALKRIDSSREKNEADQTDFLIDMENFTDLKIPYYEMWNIFTCLLFPVAYNGYVSEFNYFCWPVSSSLIIMRCLRHGNYLVSGLSSPYVICFC